MRGKQIALVLLLVLGGIGIWPMGAAAYGVGSWSTTGEMISARYNATATVLPNGKVLVAGGWSGTSTRRAEIYDPATNTWSTTGSMQTARNHHTATLLADGRVLVAGGYTNAADNYTNTAEIYDPASGTWTVAADMPTYRTDHDAILLPNGAVLVANGDGGPNHDIKRDRADIYNPSTNAWATTAPVPTPASAYVNIGAPSLLPSGSILLLAIQYSSDTFAYKRKAFLYDAATNTWKTAADPPQSPPPTGRALPKGNVTLNEGRVLIVQGDSEETLLYNPTSDTWSAAGAMTNSRFEGTFARLSDGRVLAIGGCCRSDSVDIYDPVSNSWSGTAPLKVGRQGLFSAVLPNGKVLVAGGMTGTNNVTASAELFSLSGAVVALSPTALTFGKQPLNTTSNAQTVTLANSGTTPIAVASVTISGANASDFATGADTCARTTIAPGRACSVSVNFTPRFSGQRAATLTITDDAPGSPHTVALIGAGNIAPTIGGLNPTHARAGDGAFTLTVSGTNFAPGATVRWNGADRPTTYINNTQLTAAIGAGDIADSAVADLSVFNPGPETATSNPFAFFVTANGTAITGSASATSPVADGTATASMGGTGPGSAGSLTAIATGKGTITVAGYGGNPGGTPNFGTGTTTAVGGYLDIHAAAGSAFNTVQIVNCALNNASAVFWWDGTSWLRASDQAITSPGCATITVTANSSPSISQLGGTYLAAGRQLAFSDVPASHPAYTAIRELSARGIIRGYSDGTFGPRDFTLRAQMAALITRALGWDTEERGNPFPDRGAIDDELWRNVGALQARGVAQGYADGTYNPTGDVLAEQTILFISRGMVAKGFWTVQPDDASIYPNVPATTARQQADRRDIATYVHYAGALPDMPIANGQPFVGWDKPVTRAWFARALWQALISYYGSPTQVP